MKTAEFDIGKYRITGGVLAPMAGYTDIAFRELCRRYGAGLTVTEMVSVRGLVHDSAKTELLMRVSEKERPSCVQVFGSEPDDFARAAERLACDIIDINMGCPMPKIVKNGDGAALMRDPERAGRIVAALKNATDRPITVKTRLGYNMGADGAAELIESVTKAGAAAVTVHGRYAEQRYTGDCDMQKLKTLAENTKIPFIANGDIETAEAEAPFAANMIGRAAVANPAIFSGGRVDPRAIAAEHLELLVKYFDGRYAVLQMRKFVSKYFAGVPRGREVRNAVYAAASVDDVKRALDIV